MAMSTDFKTLQESVQQSLVAVTRSANQIASQDLGFHRSLDSTVASSLDRQNARLLAIAERLLGNAAANTEVVRPRLADYDAVDSNWRGVVDVVDSLLEKADISLDEYTGAVKRLSPSREQTPVRGARSPSKIAAALRNQDIAKPQQLFQHVPTNADIDPFRPLLEEKPHATVTIDESLQPKSQPGGTQQFPHPYRIEIENYQYPSLLYTKAESIPYLPFDATTAVFVDTEEAVSEMLEELSHAKEIAIDLEHHDQRSYIGIVSLMQISTRNKDWIVDTLKPWRRKLQCLNKVFANPQILKVFHGAHMDMIWLQRDLGLYVVGLFDTHFASRALGYTGGSLAFLLKKFIDFDAQKQYQTADWRIRPLPKELFDYARSDTHFLLYIYDNMRNELIDKSDLSAPNQEKDKLNDVLVKSKEVALQTYQHPVYDVARGLGPMGWYRLLNRTPALFDKSQFAVFRAVHQWRDRVAREQDDSVHYIMANHNVFSIAKQLPLTRETLLSVAQPATQTMRLRADELLSVIREAKEGAEQNPEMWEVLKDIDKYLVDVFGETDHRMRVHQPAAPVTAPAAPTQPAASTVAFTSHPPDDSNALRLSRSPFWGTAIAPDTATQQRRPLSTAASSISLHVPLPPLTAEIFADPSTISAKPAPPIAAPPATDTTPLKQEPEIFTLKSRKRKSDVLTNGGADDADLATNADEVTLSTPSTASEQAKADKAARKAAKKAAKRAAKEQEDQVRADLFGTTTTGQHNGELATQNLDGEEEEEEFDYAAAPSVLDARDRVAREEAMQEGGRARKKKRESKEFNPYAKALDAPKGLPRAQKERAGKSMTFRS